jgi:RsiW-degrading membrane proteinase PrsW (M82 family)
MDSIALLWVWSLLALLLFLLLRILPLRICGIYYRSRLDPIDLGVIIARFILGQPIAGLSMSIGSRGSCSIV